MDSANGTSKEGESWPRRRGSGRRQTGAAFFTAPSDPTQRRYEALRAYFAEGATAPEAARRFGYAPSTMVALVRDFESDPRTFFVERRPGPRRAPAKEAARAEVLRLRREGRSVTEIAAILEQGANPLNRTGVWELVREEGLGRLGPRSPAERSELREHPPRTKVIDWPERSVCRRAEFAGVLLLVPGLVELDLPGAVAEAGFPGTLEVPALSSVLSLLALKANRAPADLARRRRLHRPRPRHLRRA